MIHFRSTSGLVLPSAQDGTRGAELLEEANAAREKLESVVEEDFPEVDEL